MKKISSYLIIAGIACLVAYFAISEHVVSADSKEVPVLIIRMAHIESPPYYFTNKKKKSEGIVIDIIDKVMKQAGYEWRPESYSVHQIINLLDSGEIHLWVGLATLPEFQKTTLIGNAEIGKVTLNAYWIGDKPRITKKEDLRGKSVLILKDYSYGGWTSFIKDPANHIRYNELYIRDPAFNILAHGRADYLLEYEVPAQKKLENMTIPNLNFSQVSIFSLKFVVSKQIPNAQEVLNRLEKAYNDLLKEGKVEKF